MSYVQPGSTQEIDPALLLFLTKLLGLSIPPDALEDLAATFADQLASMRSLDELDLTEVGPVIVMDPCWDE
jgi:hypothetical protein